MHAAEAVSSPLSPTAMAVCVTDRATRGACSAGSGLDWRTTSLGLRPPYASGIVVIFDFGFHWYMALCAEGLSAHSWNPVMKFAHVWVARLSGLTPGFRLLPR